MKIEVARTLEALDSLAAEWNALLSLSASDVPFLRHEYLRTWWQTLGGGEWPHGELYVIFARDSGGRLIGIAPFFLTENQEGETALMLLGSQEISDYLDVIARPEDLPFFLEAMLQHLHGRGAPDWQVLDLFNVLETSVTLSILQDIADRCGWLYSQQQLEHCPWIPLPGDWDTYLSRIDKKQRHEIRRKMRRAENYPEPVEWYVVNDGERLDTEVDDFFTLMVQDAEKERFLTDRMRVQMRASIRAAFSAGWLQMAFITVGGRKAAAYLNFDYGNRIWVYNSGLDFAYRELSPGWVLLGHLLQWANVQGRTAFDFLRGEEDYKYRFGAVDRIVVRAQLWRRGTPPSLSVNTLEA